MVEPQNEFTETMALTVPYEIEVKVTVNHDFSETFERNKLNGKRVDKDEFNNL